MAPAVGGSAPVIIFARVLLPLPLAPTSAVTSPARNEKLTPSTASMWVVRKAWRRV